MSVKAINSAISVQQHQKRNEQTQQQPSFTGSFNPVVTLMDAIDKGGFAASFIAQDGIGMVAPRIYEGLNRNRETDENGKKKGPLNWEFARREGIREILSGPSAFLIPMGILTLIKKFSGSANNVHVNHINVLGQDFADYASKNPTQLKEASTFKKGYYAQVFENILNNSTDKEFNVKEYAQRFADKLVEAETKQASKDKKGANKLQASIISEYMKLRKQHSAPSNDEMGVLIKGENKNIASNIKRVLQSLTDYSSDALAKTGKYIGKQTGKTAEELAQNGDLAKYIKNFNLHRSGTRVISNFSMWGAVVAFYTVIPKLYNLGIKHDPGLKGLEKDSAPEKTEGKKDKNVAFTGNFATSLGKHATQEGFLKGLFKNFEFNGASMSVPAMLTLLFGFCLPPRYANAKSDKERKEIVVRDVSSFTAILFAAKAMARGFSDAFAKISGLALNVKPEDHSKGFLHKVKNYFTAGAGIDVLTSEQIISKYSNIEDYKDGINGFFNFLEENGGNVKKVLNIDNTVKEQAQQIMKDFGGGKSLKDATLEEIHEAFKKAKGSEALEKIYTVFKSADNKFINRAKTFNSAFGFASTLVLVPTFMMWLARYCENMTKKAIAKEQAQKGTTEPTPPKSNAPQPQTIATNKPTMAGFLNK